MNNYQILKCYFTDENLEIMSEQDCVGLLLDAIQKHIKEAKAVKNSCMALAAMVEPNGIFTFPIEIVLTLKLKLLDL